MADIRVRVHAPTMHAHRAEMGRSMFRRRDQLNLPTSHSLCWHRTQSPIAFPTHHVEVGLRCHRTGRVYMDHSHTETLRSGPIVRTPLLTPHPPKRSPIVTHQAPYNIGGKFARGAMAWTCLRKAAVISFCEPQSAGSLACAQMIPLSRPLTHAARSTVPHTFRV